MFLNELQSTQFITPWELQKTILQNKKITTFVKHFTDWR